MTKHLTFMEKKILEFEVAHNELVEVFDRVKAAHQKTEAKLVHLKSILVKDRRAMEERELGLLTK